MRPSGPAVSRSADVPARPARHVVHRWESRRRVDDRRELEAGRTGGPFDGRTYGWSKHDRWRDYLDLPERTGARFHARVNRRIDEDDSRDLQRQGGRSSTPSRFERRRDLPHVHPRFAGRVHGRQGTKRSRCAPAGSATAAPNLFRQRSAGSDGGHRIRRRLPRQQPGLAGIPNRRRSRGGGRTGTS